MDLACSRWMPRRSGRIQTDPVGSSDDQTDNQAREATPRPVGAEHKISNLVPCPQKGLLGPQPAGDALGSVCWSQGHPGPSGPQSRHNDPDQDDDDERAERPSRTPLTLIEVDGDRDRTSTRRPVARIGALVAGQGANRAKHRITNPPE